MTSVEILGTGQRLNLDHAQLVIAGFTARDKAAVARHIAELQTIGVQPPDRTPAFYELAVSLVTTEPSLRVDGSMTSGEAEPVLIRAGGTLYLGVGSDHTDRAMEAASIPSAKAACGKPLGHAVVPLDLSARDWDQSRISSMVDGRPYQRAGLHEMLRPSDLLTMWDAQAGAYAEDLVMFMGTVPLLAGEVVYGAEWTVQLELPDGTTLAHSYTVKEA